MIGDTMDIFEQFRNDFTGKTVLVTGGAGFVGSDLSHRLVQLGANVRVIDNLVTGHRKNIRRSHWRWFGIC